MCRIAGIFNPITQSLQADITSMRDAMHRGGPDDAGIYIDEDIPFAMGHRRLSILDLSPAGHQPMFSSDSNLCMVFNGEIYNFPELRIELMKAGFRFTSKSDSEVLLAGYQHWGVDCFARLNGMFAVAIFDRKNKELVLARDHAGMKPLYYYLGEGKLFFASEIRAFKALGISEENPAWKPLFLMFGNIPEPFTTLKDVVMMEKGMWMKIQLPSLQKTEGYFYKDDFTVRITDAETAISEARQKLSAAVKRHLISDAPLGIFLSGGTDSSLLTLLAAPLLKGNLQTLSIQFEESQFNEEKYQRLIIEKTKAHHHFFRVSRDDFKAHLPEILEAMDMPTVDGINTWFISRFAHKIGLKAVLSGLGADEIFGGYPSFNRFTALKLIHGFPEITKRPLKTLRAPPYNKLSFAHLPFPVALYLMNRGLFSLTEAVELSDARTDVVWEALHKIKGPRNMGSRSLQYNAWMEQNFYMKHQLLRDSDVMGMWHGLEIRMPFLDKELLETINSIDPSVKFNRRITKYLLIEAFASLLPSEIWARPKQGFTFPFENWLKQPDIAPPLTRKAHIYHKFINGKLHWSRYWAVKMTA